MSFSIETFEKVAKDAEKEFQNNPHKYKKKLMLYALLGYSVIFGLVILFLSLLVGSVALAFYSSVFLLLLLKKKLIIPLGIMVWVLFKSIWVSYPRPEGYEVTKKECPELFNMLKSLEDQLDTPKIHRVILTPEFNAGIAQTPRLGIIGFHHNTLLLGLELLLTMSPAEAKSILAHELGHLSGNHSKFSNWIYRVRDSWYRIMHTFQEQGGWFTAPIRGFFNWYAPRFSAYSFALARQNEYEADAISAEITSAEDASRALVNTYATAPFVDEQYWQEYFKQADDKPEPDNSPFMGLYQFVQQNKQSKNQILDRLKRALKEPTSFADTHPSLKERLEALGDLALIPKSVEQSAAHVLLGAQLQTIISNFDEDWKAYNLEHWKAHYEQSQKDKVEYEKLRTTGEASLSKEEFFDLCWLTERYVSAEAALETALRYREKFPEDYRIAFFIGRLYLSKNDPQGIRFLEEALKEDELVESACELAYEFEISRDNQADALVWRKRAESHFEIVDKAQAERSMVSGSDTILAVSEPATLYEPIIAQFKDNPKINHIWLAQKQVKHYQSIPVFVFAIDVKGFMTSEENLLGEIMENLQTDVPVFGLTKSMDKKLYKKVCSEGLSIK